MKPRHRTVAAVLAIVVLTVAAFLPVLRAEFLLYDDQVFVTDNTAVLGGLSLRGVGQAFGSMLPVTILSHMLDVSLFGLRPGAHHFTSLILHAATAALLFLFLQGLTGAFWTSLAGAAVFAVHPMRVESVAWIAERKDVLAGLFWVLTLLGYLRYARRPGIRRYLAVAALFVLGLMSKPMVVTLPFVLLLLDWWPLGRLRGVPSSAAVAPTTGTLRVLLEKAPFLPLALAASVVTYQSLHRGLALSAGVTFTPAQRIGNALISYVHYLGKTLWPLDLYPSYPPRGPGLSFAGAVFPLLLLAGVTAAALLLRGRRPWILAGWLWYLGTLVPVIGLVQVGDQGMADRYSYIPSIGLLIAVAGEARSGASRRIRSPRLAGAGVAALLAALTALTWNQTRHWKDTVALANRMLAGDPQSANALVLLGADRRERGDAAKAVTLLTRAVELRPDFLDARFNLGLALADRGLPEAAIQQFTAVIRADPGAAESLAQRGRLLLEKGLAAPALQDLDAALAASPDRPRILHLRGLALAQLGRHAEAVAALLDAAAVAPGDADVRYHLGRAYDGMGRPAEAIASYGDALKLRPDFAEAHNNLGVTLVERGRVAEALPHFQEAVRLSPSYAEARWNLEEALRTPLPESRPLSSR